jgi:hypothetical protein
MVSPHGFTLVAGTKGRSVRANASAKIISSPGSDHIDSNKKPLPPFGQSVPAPLSFRGRGKAFDNAVALKRSKLSQHHLGSNARQKSLKIADRGRLLPDTLQQTRLPFTADQLNDMLDRARIERW